MPKKKKVTAFLAYPSRPEGHAETLAAAAIGINKSGSARVTPWTQVARAGRPVITQITQAIDGTQVFACDLTYPNHNVIFELGYAIGLLKPVWLSLDVSVETARADYQRIRPTLGDVLYASYTNSGDLAKTFVDTYNGGVRPEEHLLGTDFKLQQPRSEHPTLLYLKSPIDTDASIALNESLAGSFFGRSLIIDEPRDNPSPTLLWYADKIGDSDAVVAHLLASSRTGALDHNIKCSFVCGIAYGLGRRILMIAEEPFETPMDYRHLLRSHGTPSACRTIIGAWLEETEPQIPTRRPRRPSREQGAVDLRSLSIGEYVAEYEFGQLDEYFYETHEYFRALESRRAIFVGRRGTGKTANFYAISTQLRRERPNYVCQIKPRGYDIDGVIQVLEEDLRRAERGYLTQSLWKFLVYSELARSVRESIMGRPAYHQATADEQRFLEFTEQHSEVLLPSFAVKIDQVIAPLIGIGDLSTASDQRVRISEKLHEGLIPKLRNLLGLVLANRSKVAILIDNLDLAWTPGQRVEQFAALMLGLLEVSSDIIQDFEVPDRLGKSVNLSVIVFLRSDIFYNMRRYSPEQDKLPLHQVTWDEKEALLGVLDYRLSRTFGRSVEDVGELWRRLFVGDVGGMPVRDFVVGTVLPRPRDIIYLTREAIAQAVNRGHSMVEEQDWYSARRKYSEFALGSIMAEDDPQRQQLRRVLFAFSRAERILGRSEVEERISRATTDAGDVGYYLELLCDVNFLGVETREDFRFARHEGERDALVEVARNAARVDGREERYLINRAFYDVLQIA